MSQVLQPYNLRTRKRKRAEELEFEHQFPRKLPCEVMEIIFSFLDDWSSRIRFGAVCKSWRWVAQQYIRLKLVGQPAWIMLSKYSDSDSRDLFSFSDGRVTHTTHIAEAHGMDYCGSSQGWLIMQRHDYQYPNKFILLNPLSKAIIPLPAKAKVKSSSAGKHQILPMARILKAVLSAAPDDDCLVAAIDIHNRLYLCRTTDRCWTKQHCIKYKYFRYKDVLFYDRSIMYGIECFRAQYMVLSFMPDLNFKAKRFSLPTGPLIWNHNWSRYLAKCCGKVVLVFGVRIRGNFSQIGYRVCELESTGDDMYLESFGDGALLLDHGSCRYLPIKGCGGMNLPGNCIYVSGLSHDELCYHKMYTRNRRTGVFQWEGGRLTSNDPQRITHEDPRYVWYTPNIQI